MIPPQAKAAPCRGEGWRRIARYAGLCVAVAGVSCVTPPDAPALRKWESAKEIQGRPVRLTLWMPEEQGPLAVVPKYAEKRPASTRHVMREGWDAAEITLSGSDLRSPGSDLARAAARPAGEPVFIRGEVFRLLRRAMEVELRLPQGRIFPAGRPILQPSAFAVILPRGFLAPDLEALAVGHALDEAAGRMTREGAGPFLLEAPGVCLSRAAPPEEDAWRVRPFPGEAEVLLPPDRALAVGTGGATDEFTPARAWVVAPTAAEAVAVARSLCSLHPDFVEPWLRVQKGVEVRYEFPGGHEPRVLETPGFSLRPGGGE